MRIFTTSISVLVGSLLSMGSTASAAEADQPAITLKILSPAPSIQVATWAKGTHLTRFEPGKVYVIEFWATWCGPCKAAIPHLTELAHKYDGKVTFVGVDVLEHPSENTNEAIVQMVTPFVKSMGDKMDYTVAIDGVDGYMAKNWLEAGGQDGIPATFLVDGKGKLAWIGHPSLLEPVLVKVLDGTWDAAAEKTRSDAELAAEAPRKKALSAIMKASAKHDYVGLIAACDAAVQAVPSLVNDFQLIAYKFQGLANTDAVKAMSYAQSLTSASASEKVKRYGVMAVVQNAPKLGNGCKLATADWKTIASMIQPLVTPGMQSDWSFDAGYSNLLNKAGDQDGATILLKKSVQLLAIHNAKYPDDVHAEYYSSTLKVERKQLDALVSMAGQPMAGQSTAKP